MHTGLRSSAELCGQDMDKGADRQDAGRVEADWETETQTTPWEPWGVGVRMVFLDTSEE